MTDFERFCSLLDAWEVEYMVSRFPDGTIGVFLYSNYLSLAPAEVSYIRSFHFTQDGGSL